MTTQINKREGIVDDMDYYAGDNTTRTPKEPSDNEREYKRDEEVHSHSMKQRENDGGYQNGQLWMAPRLEQTSKKDTTKTDLLQ